MQKKKWAQARLKMLSTKSVYKSYIFDINVRSGFGIKKTNIVWYAVKPDYIYLI